MNRETALREFTIMPCYQALEWLETQPDFQTAWENCKRGDWMLWALSSSRTHNLDYLELEPLVNLFLSRLEIADYFSWQTWSTRTRGLYEAGNTLSNSSIFCMYVDVEVSCNTPINSVPIINLRSAVANQLRELLGNPWEVVEDGK